MFNWTDNQKISQLQKSNQGINIDFPTVPIKTEEQHLSAYDQQKFYPLKKFYVQIWNYNDYKNKTTHYKQILYQKYKTQSIKLKKKYLTKK